MSLRCATKGWNAAADALIDERVESGAMIVYNGKNISNRSLALRVIFLLNITKVRDYACYYAANLAVVVNIPEGVESIGKEAMTIPDSVQTIGDKVFRLCSKLVPYKMYGDEDAIVAHLRKLQLSTDVHTGCNLM
ncbi:hypothetical protein TrLO_g1566 [Triparma laevis f. longispina]|uniref:Uncharacterized protein n=1 Tax=Triparma laevis f. longispina TaxID=1714387 RepID=A0A9W7E224_9STRA|nr:hypothetical protein TrLO_g1566 [Triparma laevis f. longispina]